jgi:hypothetical protein
VLSVDLVASPATNAGFFENEINEISENKESNEMEYQDLTSKDIETNRNDIFKEIHDQGAASRDEEVKTITEEKNDLQKQLDESKAKVDEFEAKEALAAKREKVNALLEDSDLPKEAITDLFVEQLCKIDADDDSKFEEQAKKLIEDRAIAIKGKGGVKNHGGNKANSDTTKKSIRESAQG